MANSSFSQGQKYLLQIAGISAAIIALTNVYAYYKSNIWHPKVDVKDVDFKNGVAKVVINGKERTIKGDSPYFIANDWAIKFGYTFKGDGQRVYDRIEITKRGSVDSVIKKAEGEEVQSFTGTQDGYWVESFNCFVGSSKNGQTW
jgi:hypothetical protein